MKKKILRSDSKIPMNLQLFAEGGNGAGAEDGNSGGTGTDGGGNGGENGSGMKSFDDFLKEEGNQAEFDRRVQKAVNTALTKAQDKWRTLTDDKVSEADKLARMTKEEKSQYLQQKREKELTEKEAAITRRELMADAKAALAEKNIPVKLAEFLVYSDEESCKQSIEALEAAWSESVKAGVEERLKGGKPPKKAEQENAMDELQKQIENAMKG